MTSAPTKMRVAAGQHPDNDREYLDFARQLGCPGVSFQTPKIKGTKRCLCGSVEAQLLRHLLATWSLDFFGNEC